MKTFKDLQIGDPLWVIMYETNSRDEIPWFEKEVISGIDEDSRMVIFTTESGYAYSVPTHLLSTTKLYHADGGYIHTDFEEFKCHANMIMDDLKRLFDDSMLKLGDVLSSGIE